MKHPNASVTESPDALTFNAKLDRALDDVFRAQIMAAPLSGNRAERREQARDTRLDLKRLYAWACGVKAKREARVLRKARRAARVARNSPLPV